MTAVRPFALDDVRPPPPARPAPRLRRIDLAKCDALVLEYRPLADRLVAQALARGGRRGDADELKSAAHLGLVEAVHRYDEARGIPFGAFARHRIIGAILDELRAKDSLARPARARARGVEKARQKLVKKLQREPTEEELARASGEDLDTFRRRSARERSQEVVALEALPAGSWEELFAAPEPSALDALCEAERRHALGRALATLPERLRRMLALYFEEEQSLRDIGEVFGVTESRVCQLIKAAQKQLREKLAA